MKGCLICLNNVAFSAYSLHTADSVAEQPLAALASYAKITELSYKYFIAKHNQNFHIRISKTNIP